MCDDFGAGFPSGASLQLTTLDGITTGVLGAAQLALEHLEGGGEAGRRPRWWSTLVGTVCALPSTGGDRFALGASVS